MRHDQILELPLDYIYNEDFETPSREEEYLEPDAATAPRKVRVPAGLPSYLAALYDVPLLTREQEYHLFRKMNYLKHGRIRFRARTDAKHNRSKLMDEIDDLYEAAVLVKNRIVQSNSFSRFHRETTCGELR